MHTPKDRLAGGGRDLHRPARHGGTGTRQGPVPVGAGLTLFLVAGIHLFL